MKASILLLLLLFCLYSIGQPTVLNEVDIRRKKLEKSGLAVLAGWSVLNLGSGLVGRANTTGDLRQFHRSNAIWGGVNLTIAGLGYLAGRLNEKKDNLKETFKAQRRIEKLFLFNTALDLGYIAFGLYTRERALRFDGDKKDRLEGTGNSALVQGGFLALFDGVLYLLHTRNGSRLQERLEDLTVYADGKRFGIACRF